MRIFFDLDGVLRDICTYYCGYQPDEWHFRHKGMSIFQLVKEDYNGLRMAPPYSYVDVVKDVGLPVHILSTQPQWWRIHTTEWLNKFLGTQVQSVTYVGRPGDKLKFLRGDTILIDDNPNMLCYDRIALVRRPWNTGIKHAYTIINDSDELRRLIDEEK